MGGGDKGKLIQKETQRRVEIRARVIKALREGDRQELAETLAGRRGDFHPDMKAWPDDQPLLIHAVQAHSLSGVAALLNAGADIEARDSGGIRALHCAAFLGLDDILVELLARGAKVSPKTQWEERTPLMWAAKAGRGVCAMMLMKSGAAVGQRDSQGNTAESLARSQFNNQLVELLSNGERSEFWRARAPEVEALLEKGALIRSTASGSPGPKAPRL